MTSASFNFPFALLGFGLAGGLGGLTSAFFDFSLALPAALPAALLGLAYSALGLLDFASFTSSGSASSACVSALCQTETKLKNRKNVRTRRPSNDTGSVCNCNGSLFKCADSESESASSSRCRFACRAGLRVELSPLAFAFALAGSLRSSAVRLPLAFTVLSAFAWFLLSCLLSFVFVSFPDLRGFFTAGDSLSGSKSKTLRDMSSQLCTRFFLKRA